MPIRRGNPFEEIEEMFQRMSRELEGSSLGTSSMSVDVEDHGDEFVVTADLPGFEKDDIEVTLADATLRIEASFGERGTAKEGEFIRRERRRESASRSIRLPEPVDEDAIEAAYSAGVLTVTLGKREANGGRQIDIE